ncbi:MAG: helicase-related protein [Candidatus Poribacteria bacterium]|nr:helicase-related protein [Candidatus Poribacteria bacterium]
MSKTSRIRDNSMYDTVADFLRDKIQDGSALSIVSAYFTIYAFDKLKDELTGIKELRFLFGEPSFINIDPDKTESKAFEFTETGLKLQNYLPQKEVARACAEWIEEKVEIRSVRKSNFLHGKMYYIENGNGEDAIIGSSNFTVRGLGLSETASNIELNLEVDSKSDCADLKTWFDNLWESDQVADVKAQVLQTLKDAYQDKDPEFIYYKTLYHLFEDILADVGDTEFAEANPSFLQTEIWQKLYAFQKHGVQACLQKLKAYNGCIIADSVGLGKTYEALAIIKYFELRNANVLVLCPKKLEKNWTLYPIHFRRRRNPLKADRFRYNVLAHTDLSRDSGESNGIDLAQHEWDGYDLVVIDESHNFRNRSTNTLDQDDKLVRKSRYNKLLEDVIQSGGKTQVLMLSATPVNNQLTDLDNQICLITEDRDDAFRETGIPSIRGTLNAAQSRFDTWTAETEQMLEKSQKQESLAESLNADFFALLDRLTIARSRTHVINFYDNAVEEIGQFPEREPPKSIFPEIDLQGKFPTYQTISHQIDGYRLAIFNPSRYIRQECRHHYGERLLQQREFNLIGMMKVNFLKRLESSVHSFASTLERTIENIKARESEIQEFLSATSSVVSESGFDPFAETTEEYGEDDELQTGVQAGKNQTYLYEHIDLDTWLADLHDDRTQLDKIYKIAQNITSDRDAKLEQLKQLIAVKVQSPAKNRDGKENRKVLVFTAFADTANYLYDHLHEWAKETLNIESAVVTGGASRSELVRNDFDEILTNFSPISKERDEGETEADDELPEIDLLIATDCISEGQNLQDCDYLINYDIHWNPVRIIQRFGRIDRIGSKNKKIHLVNCWPTPELDAYINLKPRVEARMALVNLTATGDDDLLSLTEKASMEQVWTHRDEQLRRMQTEILDFEDIEEQLNLNQFTLDDFRAQLLDYLRQNEAKLRDAPLGLYAVTAPLTHEGLPVNIKPGVIFCLKQTGEAENSEEGKKLNPIHPYYLVHISDNGEVSIGFTNPKRILERFSALCVEKKQHDQDLCHWFNEETDNGNDMTIYEMLIDTALHSIREAYNQKVNDQLDASPDALLPTADSQIREKTEFELVTWLVTHP